MTSITYITVTYNAASVLKPTLDSVVCQTHRQIEHIIVDGASKDDTLALVQQYKTDSEAKDNGHTVMILSEPDKGIYDAMQKGINLATGRYICFLNAGDRLPNAETAAQVAALGDEHVGVIYGDTDIVDQQGQFLRHRRLSAPERLSWRSFRQGMLVCHQAFYALTDLARQTPYNLDYRYSADVDWCIRVMKEAERRGLQLKKVDGVVANYLDGGTTNQNHRASLKERFRVMRTHYGLVTTICMHAWFVVRSIFK